MFPVRVVPTIVGTPLDTTILGGYIRTVYTLISRPKCPYIYGQNGANVIVGTSLHTTTMDGNIRTVYTLISISIRSYIYGQSGIASPKEIYLQ